MLGKIIKIFCLIFYVVKLLYRFDYNFSVPASKEQLIHKSQSLELAV